MIALRFPAMLVVASLVTVAGPALGSPPSVPAEFHVEDGPRGDCVDPVGMEAFCPARVNGSEDGLSEIDLTHRINVISAATNFTKIESLLGVDLLPDGSFKLDLSKIKFKHGVFRMLAREVGTVEAPGPLHDFSFYVHDRAIGITFLGPPPKEPGEPIRKLDFHVNYSGAVEYDQIGPVNFLAYGDTDPNIQGTLRFGCHYTTETGCREPSVVADELDERTPNVKFGLEVNRTDLATDPSLLANDTAAAVPPDGSWSALRRSPALDTQEPPEETPDLRPLPRAPPQPPRESREPSRGAPSNPAPLPVAPATVRLQPPPTGLPPVAALTTAFVLAILAAALYSRIHSREDALRSQRRERILVLLRERGPMRLHALARELGLDRTTVLHHARLLSRMGHVSLIREGRSTFIALPGQPLPDAAKIGGNRASEAILDLLAKSGGMLTRDAVHQRLAEFPERSRNHALRRLLSTGLIERRPRVEVLMLASASPAQKQPR